MISRLRFVNVARYKAIALPPTSIVTALQSIALYAMRLQPKTMPL